MVARFSPGNLLVTSDRAEDQPAFRGRFAFYRRAFGYSRSSVATGLVGWIQQALAKQARVGIVTVHHLEAGLSHPRNATLEVIRHAFEAAGVEFMDESGGGPGVRICEQRRK